MTSAASVPNGNLVARRPSTRVDDHVDILIVDDRAENLLALEAILEPLHQQLIRASSGEEALRRLLERDFAVILLDVQMPGMNGFEPARLIKARERTKYIPIIFLTAISKEEAYVFEGYSVGAVDYLFKPFQPEILRSKVAAFVDLYMRQRNVAAKEAVVRESERREMELRHMRELWESQARFREVVTSALDAIILFDDAANITLFNSAAERMFCSSSSDAVGTPVSRFFPDNAEAVRELRASMSHELRTPINAVLGYSTLLLENIYGPLNEKQREGIERTHKAAKHLLELVNDVLDLSKIEAGKIDLRLQPVSFPSLIEDLFVTVRPLADQYGSTLRIEHTGDSMRIVSDPRRVRQILLNLLSNAIKFGRGKPIRVVLQRREDNGVIVEVIDEGEGIGPDDQERIFQEFVQLGKTQLTEGTGLGLPISRRLAELLRGSPTLASAPGRGSTFRLSLPQTAERAPTVRLTDQELASPPADERGSASDDDGDAGSEGVAQPQTASRMAS